MTNKPRILIVDDVSSNIHLLMTILKEKYSIIVATNGEKALKLAKTAPMPDLILLDVVMPGMDGYEVCEKIKSDENCSHIPIVFVTSLNSIEEQEKSLKVGAVDFITKPFSKDIVLHKVETYLNIENSRRNSSHCFLEEKETIVETEKQSILVVDDSPENIQVVIEVLKNDYVVSVATSGKKSLEMLDTGLKPDLILLDVIMPEMDGYELCEILKSKKEYKDIPVIFVTILEHEKDIVRGFKLGAVDYAVKPIEPTVLKARMETHLKLKSYHDTLIEDIKIKNELIYHQSKLATLGEMFENITHQWKQPLSSISVATSGINIHKEYGDLNDDILNQSLDTIDTSVKYLAQTIDDFKNFLVVDSSKYCFNIKDVVDSTIKLLNPKLKENFIAIENKVGDIQVENYKNELIQVLMNILSNAIDALSKKESDKKIWIETLEDETHLVICVKDNAGGINEENMDKVFEKYFTTKENEIGTGIGLFMSRNIAQTKLDGDVRVLNIENGACFEIAIPK